MHYVSVQSLLKHGCLIGECFQNNDTTRCYHLYQNRQKSTVKPSCTHPFKEDHVEIRDESPIVCQTPWLCMPMQPRYIVRHNKRVHFINLSFTRSTEHRYWLLFLNQFQEVLQTILHRNEKHFETYTWMNMLEQSPNYAFSTTQESHLSRLNAKLPMWKITTVLSKALQCYDIHQQNIPVNEFLTGNTKGYVRLIVQFSHVWVNTISHTAGVAVNILQMQQHASFPLQTYAFTNSIKPCRTVGTQTDTLPLPVAPTAAPSSSSMLSNSMDIRCNHPVYGTYFKMLSKRVPKPAVQHKMRMNGLNPDILDWDISKPLPSSCDHEHAQPVDQLSLSLQDDHQLRKTDINTHTKKPRDGAGHGFSLDEIVNGLKSLRKTFLGNGEHSLHTTTTDATISNVQHPRNTVGDRPKPKAQNSSFMKLLESGRAISR